MRPVEIITIYFAAGAPIGVIYFLQRQTKVARWRALVFAFAAGLVWPIASVALLLARKRIVRGGAATAEGKISRQNYRQVQRSKRSLYAALNTLEDLTKELFGTRHEKARQALFDARESVERYTGLYLAATEARLEDPPTARELELYRLAGRTGEDLLRAGSCLHRRNVARLITHCERARTKLLHALADIRETSGADVLLDSPTNTRAARPLSEALLQVYGQAIELLSFLDDTRMAMSVAQLLDAECARLHALASFGFQDKSRERAPESEQCTPPIPTPSTLPITRPPQSTPLRQG